MTPRPSGENSILANQLGELKHVVEGLTEFEESEKRNLNLMWMFMFGILPNGSTKIEPSVDSWCGRMEQSFKDLRQAMMRWLWAMSAFLLLGILVEHGDKWGKIFEALHHIFVP